MWRTFVTELLGLNHTSTFKEWKVYVDKSISFDLFWQQHKRLCILSPYLLGLFWHVQSSKPHWSFSRLGPKKRLITLKTRFQSKKGLHNEALRPKCKCYPWCLRISHPERKTVTFEKLLSWTTNRSKRFTSFAHVSLWSRGELAAGGPTSHMWASMWNNVAGPVPPTRALLDATPGYDLYVCSYVIKFVGQCRRACFLPGQSTSKC